MYSHDNRVVITLDAGGTNLVFGAMQANKFIVEPITLRRMPRTSTNASRRWSKGSRPSSTVCPKNP